MVFAHISQKNVHNSIIAFDTSSLKYAQILIGKYAQILIGKSIWSNAWKSWVLNPDSFASFSLTHYDIFETKPSKNLI